MPELSKDLIALLQYLLPGFLVAWICYGLTSHQKPAHFERVVQALIYAIFVHFLTLVVKVVLLKIGQSYSLMSWSDNVELFTSFVLAVLVGVIFSSLINSDRVHKIFRTIGLSTRSSHPSEWCTAFDNNKKFVIAHLKDERRLYGWPHIWPSDPAKGHLYLTQATWLSTDTDDAENVGPEREIMLDVLDVKWIEFI